MYDVYLPLQEGKKKVVNLWAEMIAVGNGIIPKSVKP